MSGRDHLPISREDGSLQVRYVIYIRLILALVVYFKMVLVEDYVTAAVLLARTPVAGIEN